MSPLSLKSWNGFPRITQNKTKVLTAALEVSCDLPLPVTSLLWLSHLSPLTSTLLASQHQLFPQCRLFFPRCFGFAHFVNEIDLDCVNSTHSKLTLTFLFNHVPLPHLLTKLCCLIFSFFHTFHHLLGFPGGVSDKQSACQRKRCKRLRLDPRIGKISWRRAWQPTPIFLPGESHGHRSLVSGRLQSIGSQKVRHDWSDLAHMHAGMILWTVRASCVSSIRALDFF